LRITIFGLSLPPAGRTQHAGWVLNPRVDCHSRARLSSPRAAPHGPEQGTGTQPSCSRLGVHCTPASRLMPDFNRP
jgi:hypothetical protein